MQLSPLTIFLLGREDFEEVRQSPGSLGGILKRKAEAMTQVRSAEAREAPKP